jgi:hypothetical protein
VDRPLDRDEGAMLVRNVGSSKRRVEIDHYDMRGKRTKFKMTTAEYYAGHVTDT